MSVYDAPNQQVVREDGSGPGVDAEAQPEAQKGTSAAEQQTDQAKDELEDKTKDDLLAYAHELGVSPAHQGMTKAELIDSIRAAEG